MVEVELRLLTGLLRRFRLQKIVPERYQILHVTVSTKLGPTQVVYSDVRKSRGALRLTISHRMCISSRYI